MRGTATRARSTFEHRTLLLQAGGEGGALSIAGATFDSCTGNVRCRVLPGGRVWEEAGSVGFDVWVELLHLPVEWVERWVGNVALPSPP